MTTSPDKLISHSEYTNAIRAFLPKEAFQPEPKKIFILAAHVVVVLSAYVAIQAVSSWFLSLPAVIQEMPPKKRKSKEMMIAKTMRTSIERLISSPRLLG